MHTLVWVQRGEYEAAVGCDSTVHLTSRPRGSHRSWPRSSPVCTNERARYACTHARARRECIRRTVHRVTPLMQIRSAAVTEKGNPAIPNTEIADARKWPAREILKRAPPFAAVRACSVLAKGIPCADFARGRKFLETSRHSVSSGFLPNAPDTAFLPVLENRAHR